MQSRFRGFLPVVVDVETAGFNAEEDALLEIAMVFLGFDREGNLMPYHTYHEHITPFEGAVLNKEALEFNKIDPHHPFRFSKTEGEAFNFLLPPIHAALKETGCQRAVLVGHNPSFDLGFLNAAFKRTNIESPFHAFTTFDTATLAAVAFGQTVLLRAAHCAGLQFDGEHAHSAVYDAEKTAELFCHIVNLFPFEKK